MSAVSTVMKRKNDHSFTRSASAPDTIEAVVATNTIWEEPVRHRGIPVLHDRGGSLLSTVQQRDFLAARAVKELQRPKPAPSLHPDVHDIVADQVEGQPRDGVQTNVLQADYRCVLGAHRARLQHGEARAHPHHQRAPHKKREAVQNELCLPVNSRARRQRRKRQEEKENARETAQSDCAAAPCIGTGAGQSGFASAHSSSPSGTFIRAAYSLTRLPLLINGRAGRLCCKPDEGARWSGWVTCSP